jgi:type IV pilus assembly protein PilC
MAKFTYAGETSTGDKVQKTIEANDRFEVYEIARKEGHTISSISEGSSFSLRKYFDIEKINYFLSRVKADELVMTTRNLGSMLVAGLPLSRALSVIERQSTNPRLKGVMRVIQARITKGDQFNEALTEFPNIFDDLYVAMVRAGEESGGLSDTLQILSVQMERSSSLKKKIKGAMIYPAIVMTIMVGIGILMMIYVMPSITGTFKGLGADLPATTKALIAMSDFMTAHTILSLGILFGSIALFIYALRTKIGKRVFSWIVVRLPIIGNIAKEANAASMARTLSSLLSSGVDVLRALSITKDVIQNFYYKEIIAEAFIQVEKGAPLSETFIKRKDLYPILVGEMISVGEETGQISNMLKELAVFYENEVEHKTDDLSTIIEPLLMVVIGGTVGFFALAMIAPIYSIADSIN